MADLFDRGFVRSNDYTKIAGHYMRAALGDYAAGYTTRAQIIAFFEMDSEAQADLNALCNALDLLNENQKIKWLVEFHDVWNIAEAGGKYTTKTDFKNRLSL